MDGKTESKTESVAENSKGLAEVMLPGQCTG